MPRRDCQRDERPGHGRAALGAHLEGPFLAKEYKGAMPEALLREGDENLLRAYQNRFPGVIRYITVSPEVPGVVDMIGKNQPRRDGGHRPFRRGLRHEHGGHPPRGEVRHAHLQRDAPVPPASARHHGRGAGKRLLVRGDLRRAAPASRHGAHAARVQGLGSGYRHHGQHHGGGSAGRQLQARGERRGRPGRGRGARLKRRSRGQHADARAGAPGTSWPSPIAPCRM